ncbi:hypothetical protein G1K46_06170 [Tenacibaculum finnmarkense]|uniref:hypothetical protein n=1 Tax=Tenacibaculum finnmarkense TaxID=2781243 RepID=UPI001EFB479D|nr:hypothetical protein [Tenacibaculum finnmarkense]MCG8732589.1 hypothetical protein [Tenacibaculum finnmarkense]MCG8762328.1 hypothetical protein [Tenacibaculum finnmarkense]MCG8787920.1 hypothetical protein [Tenacibaculum finnmarkense]WCC41873.1 hypothetical protein PJJ26_10445 [Tenacibaculum finnmarkense]
MKEVRISETANGIVKVGSVVNKITDVNNRYELSKEKSENLLNDLQQTTTSIASTTTNFFGNYRKDDLFDLIQESHNSTLKTTIITNELIQNNNENTKVLSEMISFLAMLSATSFQKISETSSELEAITEELEKGVGKIGGNSTNINRVVISQIKKVKEEKQKQEDIDYNFGALNENFKELNVKLQDYKESSLKELKELKELYEISSKELNVKFQDYKESSLKELKELKELYETSSEDHFIKTLKRQKTMIYVLFLLFLVSLIPQLIPFIKS